MRKNAWHAYIHKCKRAFINKRIHTKAHMRRCKKKKTGRDRVTERGKVCVTERLTEG